MFSKTRILGVSGDQINMAPSPVNNAIASFQSRASSSSTKITASSLGFGASSVAASGVNVMVNNYWQSLYQYFLTGLAPADPHLIDTSTLALFYRDIYLFDNVAGSAVDIQSHFPFSGWKLRGLETHELDTFNEALDQLHLQQMMPLISKAHLIDGFFCGSIAFNRRTKDFMTILIHDALSCAVIPSPFFGIDPTINVRVSQATQQYLNNASEYARQYIESMPHDFIEMLRSGSFNLNPLTTLFVPRMSTTDRAYTSYLHRILPMYFIEKTLFRGTLVEAQRRQRAITHLTAGDENWTPTAEELATYVAQFQAAECDPLGGWISTRNAVQATDIRCLGGDTLINTDQGLIPIKDLVKHNPNELQEGTRVKVDIRAKNHKGEYAPVKYWWYQGIKPTYNLDFSDGTHLEATSNHKFVTIGSDCRLGLIKTSEITEDTWLLKTKEPKGVDIVKAKVIEGKEQHVYDLTMDESVAPIFCANGVLSKNSGGDFWKWTDMSDILTPYKLRALGISEAFLSGDASFAAAECLVGDTAITQEDGSTRTLESMCPIPDVNPTSLTPGEWYPLETTIPNRISKGAKTCAWAYRGYKDTFKVTTAEGHQITATDNHPFFVMQADGTTCWKKLDELKVRDQIAVIEVRFVEITSIEPAGKNHVYDLSMAKGEDPSFIANGIVVHNSAYSTFLESQNSYRNDLTERIFYSKIFPLIAIANGYYKDPSKKSNDIVRFLFDKRNRSNLKIPELHWDKQLEARGEDNMREMLEIASEKGIPIPLRMWMAACGIEPDNLFRDLKEDKALREKLEEYTGKDTSYEGEQNSLGDDFDDEERGTVGNPEYARVKNRVGGFVTTQSIKNIVTPLNKSLADREFGESGDRWRLTKTGKVQYIPSAIMPEIRNRSNDMIMKIVKKNKKS
jgi:hypothetical protein